VNRRSHGVNLDDGIALSTDEEFQLLFVDGQPEVRSTLQGWLADDEQDSMLFGGQIGTGKTTLLNEVLRTQPNALAIRIRFDTDCIDATEGGYVQLLFGQVLQACLNNSVSPDGCGIVIKDLVPLDRTDWRGVAHALTHPPETLAQATRLRENANVLTGNSNLVRRAVHVLLERLAEATKRRPVLVADGVDKFNPSTADYFALKDTLAFLAKHKTLFEVNAVHLFRADDFCNGIAKLFVGGLNADLLQQIFLKRLGGYGPAYSEAFSALADYCGGNVRQGLRLLNGYYHRRTQMRNDHTAALALACHRVGADLLSVPFDQFPADVFSVVKKDHYMEGSLLKNKLSAAAASDAVYKNWLFLDSEPSKEAPTQWPARINPLIDMAIDWKQALPPTPEEEAVRKWAAERHISPIGLNVPVDENGKPAWKEFWEEMESSSSSEDETLSILQLLEEIAAGLYGTERQDRIIVSYKQRGNLESVRDFLIGKANTYSFFPCTDIMLVGGDGEHPIEELMSKLSTRDPNCIYSVEMQGNWTDAQLRDLEHRRDLFDNLQMLWWVQEDALQRYLPFWQQLRQLFRIYRLEEELWRDISVDEIEADIELIQDLSSENDPEGVCRLKGVLEFLRTGGNQDE
jgi:hypothetical protein